MNALQSVADAATKATTLQLVGAFLFGMVIGWFVYFVNRHRTEEVKLADVATLVAAIGAGAILVLFPAGTDLFGSYGIGLAVGFFLYFGVLLLIVAVQKKERGWTFEWFLDGRAPRLAENQERSGSHPMGSQAGGGPR